MKVWSSVEGIQSSESLTHLLRTYFQYVRSLSVLRCAARRMPLPLALLSARPAAAAAAVEIANAG